MTSNPEKAALRKHLLEKRDSTSFDLMEIHSEKIVSKLMKTKVISEAESIGCYYSIGSEVQTVELISHLLNEKKSVSLPIISNSTMSFRIVDNLSTGFFKNIEYFINTYNNIEFVYGDICLHL